MATTVTLPAKALQVYSVILAHKEKNDGNSPSYRQIAAYMGFKAVSTVQYYVAILRDANMIDLVDDNITVGGKWTPPKNIRVLS